MRAAIATAVLVAVTAAAGSADPVRMGAPHESIRRIVVYGHDACPQGSGDEIVICARRSEKDRYRIPEQFRDQPSAGSNGAGWASRSQSMEYVGRTGTESCSPTGPGGSSGCWNKLVRDARREHSPH